MKKTLYKIITVITLAVPLPIYLFLSATIFNIVPDYTFKNATIDEVLTETVDDYTFIYTNDTSAVLNGSVTYYDGHYGFYIDGETIIKADDGIFSYALDEKSQTYSFQDIKLLEKQTQTSYKLPIAFFISAVGAGIVFLVVSKKMEWYKKFPRIATLVGLATGTGILFLMNVIIGNIMNVFLVATISWAVYCLEYSIQNNLISETKAKKTESDLLQALKEAINE